MTRHAPFGRKAQLEIQFNWIFVLIVGAVILAFFLTVINNQQKKASAEEASDLVNTLDTRFTTIRSNPDTLNNFSIANAKVEFICEPELSQYYIQGAGPVQTKYDAIFTPAVLQGDVVITWTRSWEVPFEVTTFTNMATDRVLFIFVNNQADTVSDEDDPITELYAELPGRYRKVLVASDELGQLPMRGYQRYVVIATAIPPGGWTTEKYHLRLFSTGFDPDGSGSVRFMDGGPVEERSYVTRDAVFGAIFTEDAETYDCTMTKALLRLRAVAAILEHRANNIAAEMVYTPCYDYFVEAQDQFSTLASLKDYFDASIMASLQDAREKLEDINALAWRGYTCPYIY